MNIRKIYLNHSLSEVFFYKDRKHPLIATLQQLLSSRGLYQGPVHSLYDKKTQEAVTHFQMAEGLPATGVVDPITYCRLYPYSLKEIVPSMNTERIDFSLPRGNILITKSQRQLTLFNDNQTLHQYPVGIGKPATPTPSGNYAVATKVMNPGGMLGSRWLGLNFDTYGIHGTSQPWLIGQMVSHGCIRMHNPNVEELFALVRIGTPVYIRD